MRKLICCARVLHVTSNLMNFPASFACSIIHHDAIHDCGETRKGFFSLTFLSFNFADQEKKANKTFHTQLKFDGFVKFYGTLLSLP